MKNEKYFWGDRDGGVIEQPAAHFKGTIEECLGFAKEQTSKGWTFDKKYLLLIHPQKLSYLHLQREGSLDPLHLCLSRERKDEIDCKINLILK